MDVERHGLGDTGLLSLAIQEVLEALDLRVSNFHVCIKTLVNDPVRENLQFEYFANDFEHASSGGKNLTQKADSFVIDVLIICIFQLVDAACIVQIGIQESQVLEHLLVQQAS